MIMWPTVSIGRQLQVAGHVVDEIPQVLHVVGEKVFLCWADGYRGNNLQVQKTRQVKTHVHCRIIIQIRSYPELYNLFWASSHAEYYADLWVDGSVVVLNLGFILELFCLLCWHSIQVGAHNDHRTTGGSQLCMYMYMYVRRERQYTLYMYS